MKGKLIQFSLSALAIGLFQPSLCLAESDGVVDNEKVPATSQQPVVPTKSKNPSFGARLAHETGRVLDGALTIAVLSPLIVAVPPIGVMIVKGVIESDKH